MAKWTKAAHTDWAAGMRDEKSNSLNSSEQIKLREKVEKWADGIGDSQTSKILKVGNKLGVKVTARNAEVTGVKFGVKLG